jgi:hypothetical protein
MSAPYGIIFGEAMPIYHANDAWSNSKLQIFRRYPVEAQRRFVTKVAIKSAKSDDSRSKVLGSAWHAATFEGEEAFRKRFALSKFDSFRTDAAKAWKAKMSLDGVEVLTETEDAKIQEMIRSTRAHPVAQLLLSAGRPEVTFRKHLERFDVQCRPDWWNREGLKMFEGAPLGAYFVDGKTTASLCLDDYWANFRMQFQKEGYYYQAALYRELIALLDPLEEGQIRPAMFYIAQENDEPFQCQVFEPDPETYATAMMELRADLEQLQKCYETGVWPGAPVALQTLYLQKKFEQRRLAAAEQKGLSE